MTTPDLPAVSALLAEWRDTAAEATPGPWTSGGDDRRAWVWATPNRRLPAPLVIHDVLKDSRVNRRANAAFIATARTALPRTIAALEAVLGMHHPLTNTPDGPPYCGACVHLVGPGEYPDWPCDTVHEITAALHPTDTPADTRNLTKESPADGA